MNRDDYPALYRAADDASCKAQSMFLLCIKSYGLLTAAGAGLAAYGIRSAESATLAAIVFMLGLAVSLLMAFRRYETVWYRARAVAESIKTVSWRFMMRAEPFDNQVALADARRSLAQLLRKIFGEHKGLLPEIAETLSKGEQLTETMTRVRQLPLRQRMNLYLQQRVDEQLSWYADKAKVNSIDDRRWFSIFTALQVGAVTFMILRIVWPTFEYWPTEVAVVGAASALVWMQIKRFRELAAAYGLAATEIGIARTLIADIDTDEAFSSFVADTENAFSREHTQWIARRDSGV